MAKTRARKTIDLAATSNNTDLFLMLECAGLELARGALDLGDSTGSPAFALEGQTHPDGDWKEWDTSNRLDSTTPVHEAPVDIAGFCAVRLRRVSAGTGFAAVSLSVM